MVCTCRQAYASHQMTQIWVLLPFCLAPVSGIPFPFHFIHCQLCDCHMDYFFHEYLQLLVLSSFHTIFPHPVHPPPHFCFYSCRLCYFISFLCYSFVKNTEHTANCINVLFKNFLIFLLFIIILFYGHSQFLLN